MAMPTAKDAKKAKEKTRREQKAELLLFLDKVGTLEAERKESHVWSPSLSTNERLLRGYALGGMLLSTGETTAAVLHSEVLSCRGLFGQEDVPKDSLLGEFEFVEWSNKDALCAALDAGILSADAMETRPGIFVVLLKARVGYLANLINCAMSAEVPNNARIVVSPDGGRITARSTKPIKGCTEFLLPYGACYRRLLSDRLELEEEAIDDKKDLLETGFTARGIGMFRCNVCGHCFYPKNARAHALNAACFKKM